MLENRNGTLYEVGPGSNLPGVGKVETIKRIDGKVVVTTPKGTITSALEPPRRPAVSPAAGILGFQPRTISTGGRRRLGAARFALL